MRVGIKYGPAEVDYASPLAVYYVTSGDPLDFDSDSTSAYDVVCGKGSTDFIRKLVSETEKLLGDDGFVIEVRLFTSQGNVTYNAIQQVIEDGDE